jgi:hypothetical protein
MEPTSLHGGTGAAASVQLPETLPAMHRRKGLIPCCHMAAGGCSSIVAGDPALRWTSQVELIAAKQVQGLPLKPEEQAKLDARQ